MSPRAPAKKRHRYVQEAEALYTDPKLSELRPGTMVFEVFETEKLKGAESGLQMFVDQKPENPELLLWLGGVQYVRGDQAKAEKTLRHYLGKNPDCATVGYIWLSDVLDKQGRLEEARESFDRALELDPTLPSKIEQYRKKVKEALRTS